MRDEQERRPRLRPRERAPARRAPLPSRGCRSARRRARPEAVRQRAPARPAAARQDSSAGAAPAYPECRDRSAAHSRTAVPPAPAADQEKWQLDVLNGGQGRHQVEELEHEADLATTQARELGLNPSIRSPSSQTSPAVGRSSPASRLSSVDFPHPLGSHDRDELAALNRDVDLRRPSTSRCRFRTSSRDSSPRVLVPSDLLSQRSRCSISSSQSRSAFRCKIAPSTRSCPRALFHWPRAARLRSRSDLEVLASLPFDQLLRLRQVS